MEYDNPINFIKDLKSQHRSIISTMCDIDSQDGGASNIRTSVEKLNKITDLLFNHLEKEDKQLYPTLINAKETQDLGKKYYYDMERLSCIAIDFFKKYCAHNEGGKIFVEDFVNAYSLFKGLLKTRIKREEAELYPAFILLQSGVLDSEVLNYIHEQERKVSIKQKNVIVCGKDPLTVDALALTLEIAGHKVTSTHNTNRVLSLIESRSSDLILIDLSENNKELGDLVTNLKMQLKPDAQIVGFSRTAVNKELEHNLAININDFIPNATSDIEGFSNTIGQLLTK